MLAGFTRQDVGAADAIDQVVDFDLGIVGVGERLLLVAGKLGPQIGREPIRPSLTMLPLSSTF
jgi:hypothetical protein